LRLASTNAWVRTSGCCARAEACHRPTWQRICSSEASPSINRGVGKLETGERPLRLEEAHTIGEILWVDPATLTQLSQIEDRDTALKQLLRAEENVARLQRQVDELRMELDRAVDNLEDAQIMRTDAQQKMAALGAAEVDGMWRFFTDSAGLTDAAVATDPRDTDGER
jgi:hypothetical protein